MSFSESPVDVTSTESRQELDHPWAIWTAFCGMSSWFFRRGAPPTLQHPRFIVRLLRMIALMGMLAGVSVTACMAAIGFEMAMEAAGTGWQLKGFGLMLFPGVWFGLFVLVPLSRWQGRNWWLTISAVPISTGIYWCAVMDFLQFMPIMSSSNGKSWLLAGLTSGATGGFGLAIWMNPPWSRRAVIVIALSMVMGIIGAINFAVLFHDDPNPPWLPEPFSRLLAIIAMFGPFHVGVAMALGLRLIWSDSPRTGG